MIVRPAQVTTMLVWLAACGSLLAGTQWSGLRFLGAVWLLAVALTGESTTVVRRLPLAGVLLIAGPATVAAATGWAGWPGWAVAVTLTVFGAAALWRQRGSSRLKLGLRGAGGAGLALVLAIGYAIVALQPFEMWSRNFFFGTDFERHVRLLAQLAAHGRDPASVYPDGLHATVAWIAGDPVGLQDMRAAWIALASVVLTLAALMACGIGAQVECLAATLRVGRWWLAGAATIAIVAYLESPWFDAILAEGYAVNYAVGLVLVAALLGVVDAGWWRRQWAPAEMVVAAVAAVYTWQFFAPIPAVIFALAVAAGGRAGLAKAMVAGLLGVMAVVPMVLAATGMNSTSIGRGGGAVGWIQAPVGTTLGPPGWWWNVALVLTLLSVVLVWRAHARWPAAGLAAAVATAVTTIWVLFLVARGSWLFLPYYPAKYLWTATVLVFAPAAITVVWGASALWRWAARSRYPLLLKALVGAVGALALVGVVGFQSALRPNLLVAATQGLGVPPYPLMLVEAYQATGRPAVAGQEALVFGLVPSVGAADVRGSASVVDTIAMDALYFLDLSDHYRQPPSTDSEYEMRGAVRTRDFQAICQWLDRHPDDLVLTGPNPASGWVWLKDAGCPEASIRPARWVSLDLADAWWHDTGVDPHATHYPTYEEWERAVQEGRTRKVTELAPSQP